MLRFNLKSMGLEINQRYTCHPLADTCWPFDKAGELKTHRMICGNQGGSAEIWKITRSGTFALKVIHTAPTDTIVRPPTDELPPIDRPGHDTAAPQGIAPEELDETMEKRHAAIIESHHTLAAYDEATASEGANPFLQTYGVVNVADEVALVMEFFEGQTLERFLKHNQLSQKQKIKLAIHICRALILAEKAGIQHRDIKPENILVQIIEVGGKRKLRIKIIDFGIAVDMQDAQDGFENLTGTLEYMPPRIYQAFINNQHIHFDKRQDMYAFGVLLWKIFIGDFNKHPYINDLSNEINAARDIYKASRVIHQQSDCPYELEFMIYRMLHIQEDERPDWATVWQTLNKVLKELASAA